MLSLSVDAHKPVLSWARLKGSYRKATVFEAAFHAIFEFLSWMALVPVVLCKNPIKDLADGSCPCRLCGLPSTAPDHGLDADYAIPVQYFHVCHLVLLFDASR